MRLEFSNDYDQEPEAVGGVQDMMTHTVVEERSWFRRAWTWLKGLFRPD